ncbi:MAG TPA: copper resistance protein CopC [Gaiellaceae bacterium]|nr:copper resistance protein CopC [Gaiellaceae bacterium]
MRRALFLAALAALALPATAFAHASLKKESPSFGQELRASPRTIVLQFDQTVQALPKSIQVLTPDGRNLARKPRAITAQRQIVASVPRLPKGAYTIRWQAISNDGHIVSGVYTFGVRVKAPPVTSAVGAQGPTSTENVVRWLYFVALALLVGGLGFRLLIVRGPLPPRAQRRFFWVTGIGAVALLQIGIVAFLLRGEDMLQLPFSLFIYGDLSPLATGTRFGQTFIAMTLGFVLVTAFLYLAWLLDLVWPLWVAFGLGLFFASGLSLSGHSAADAGHSWVSELADWVHLTSAMLWVGGLVLLLVVIWPGAPELRRTAFLRFSKLATVLVALLLAAGTYLSVLRFPNVHDLWTTGYGHVLLVKLSLVALALLWGAVHHFVAAPRLAAGDSGTLAGRLSRSMLGESTVAMAVLLAAAFLVNTNPPPQPSPRAPVAAHATRR